MAGLVRIGGGDSVDVNQTIDGSAKPQIVDSDGAIGNTVVVRRFDSDPPVDVEATIQDGDTVVITWGPQPAPPAPPTGVKIV